MRSRPRFRDRLAGRQQEMRHRAGTVGAAPSPPAPAPADSGFPPPPPPPPRPPSTSTSTSRGVGAPPGSPGNRWIPTALSDLPADAPAARTGEPATSFSAPAADPAAATPSSWLQPESFHPGASGPSLPVPPPSSLREVLEDQGAAFVAGIVAWRRSAAARRHQQRRLVHYAAALADAETQARALPAAIDPPAPSSSWALPEPAAFAMPEPEPAVPEPASAVAEPESRVAAPEPRVAAPEPRVAAPEPAPVALEDDTPEPTDSTSAGSAGSRWLVTGTTQRREPVFDEDASDEPETTEPETGEAASASPASSRRRRWRRSPPAGSVPPEDDPVPDTAAESSEAETAVAVEEFEPLSDPRVEPGSGFRHQKEVTERWLPPGTKPPRSGGRRPGRDGARGH